MSSSLATVLITGANSGIGFATAKVLAASPSGYRIVLAGRSLEKVKAAVEQIKSTSKITGQLSSIQLDVTDPGSINAAAEQITRDFGSLNVLINNAGIAEREPGAPYHEREMQSILMTNIAGPALVAQAFNPLLLKSEKKAYSLFITSNLGSLRLASDPEAPAYKATWDIYRMSKAALNMLAVQQAKSLRDNGVMVFAVCPGLVRSNLRGTSEEAVSAGGYAGDPDVAGNTILSIVEGKRDTDVGKLVHKDGVYPW